ncbi:STE24 endopeptidase [Ardenticatena maritima]|nr:M48 family metallopeptidase [Ardenticatena maritima]GAP63533.1 STE24 endopeptidase [Ardenticatena maritima]
MNEPRLDPQRQARAREYARIRRRLLLLNIGLTFGGLVFVQASGLSVWLRDWLVAHGLHSPWALVAAYVALGMTAYTLALLPLDWYEGYVLPHRFELSTQTPRGWLIDQLKSFALSLLLGIPIAEVLYWLLRAYPTTWWIFGGMFLLFLTIVLGQLAPVLIVPLFYTLTPLDDEELRRRIERLAQRVGVRIADVYTIDLSSRTRAANAMVMGLGRTKRIALGDTLYNEYDADEIETILAHELGHQVHHDLELGILVQSLLTFGGLYLAHRFLQWGVGVFGLKGVADIAGLPLFVLAMSLFALITMPLGNAYSRWRERLADAFALRTTGKPEAFARAMTRLANQNLAEADPPRWVVWLLYSHPPIRERIEAAHRFMQSESTVQGEPT